MTHYYLNLITKLSYIFALVCITTFTPMRAQELTKECINCFSTELISIESEDDCTTIQLKIQASDCNSALSHFTVEVPCGTVTSASNSRGWPIEVNSEDPTSGIYGLKVDNINNFGEDGDSASFTLEYTVCYTDQECKNILKTGFDIAYKAATCIFIDRIESENPPLDGFLTTQDLICNGDVSGTVITTITEGTEPFTFLWNTGATTKDLINVPAGYYEITITDANGENLTLSAQINQPEAISIQASIQNANCGQNDGSIEVTASGGKEPYSYEWSNGATTSMIDQLQSGQYTVTVTDSIGCSKSFNYNIKNETTVRATITTDNLECHEEGTGSLTVTVTGGIEPYSYLWDNGDTTSTATDLNSGIHKVIITDAVGCTTEKTSYVIISKLNASAVINNPLCSGESNGSATITIINGTEPYDIIWNTGSTETTISDLAAGWYWADITDANGCEYRKYVNITQPNELTISASLSKASCNANDSSIIVDIIVSGGTPPYTYYRDGAETDKTITVDETGYYEFTVIDANGCEKTQEILVTRPEANLNTNITVSQPTCASSGYGSAAITVINGEAPYTIIWFDGSEAMNRNNLTEGDYEVLITDAIGCTSQHTITINSVEIASAEIIAPDAMPECSSSNNLLYAFTNNASSYQWSISNTASGWTIESQTEDQISYTAGEGSTWVQLLVKSIDNCEARDSILLNCQALDDSNPTDSISGGDDDKNCDSCYEIIPTDIKQLDDNCYKYTITVKTDGSCSYDLSHLSIEVKDGYVKSVYNSKGWKTELNSTDPTTGIFGFKIDDISNFGKSKDQFNIEYTICFEDESQREFAVAYKSAQCVVMDVFEFNQEQFNTSLSGTSYPNPFTDATQIEFTSKTTTDAELYIYDIYGNLVECLYSGPVEANTNYNFEFRPDKSMESIFFYRLICGDEIIQGKLMKIR